MSDHHLRSWIKKLGMKLAGSNSRRTPAQFGDGEWLGEGQGTAHAGVAGKSYRALHG